MSGQERSHRKSGRLADQSRLIVCAQVIFQEPQIPLQRPVDLCRGTEAIVEPELAGILFTRRTMPSFVFTAHISSRHFLGQRRQFVFHFPFFPSGAVTPENKEVWRMCMAVIGAGFGFVSQSEG